MPSTSASASALDKIKAKRIQAEKNVKELREAEIDAAFRETPVSDQAYIFVCRVRAKQRQLTQQARHRVGRKRYSIEVQQKKLDQSRAEQEELVSLLNKREHSLAKLEEDVCARREVMYQALGE